MFRNSDNGDPAEIRNRIAIGRVILTSLMALLIAGFAPPGLGVTYLYFMLMLASAATAAIGLALREKFAASVLNRWDAALALLLLARITSWFIQPAVDATR